MLPESSAISPDLKIIFEKTRISPDLRKKKSINARTRSRHFLISTFPDIFSTNSTDIGTTNKVKHRIELYDTTTIQIDVSKDFTSNDR